jgi:hypothetical protein
VRSNLHQNGIARRKPKYTGRAADPRALAEHLGALHIEKGATQARKKSRKPRDHPALSI